MKITRTRFRGITLIEVTLCTALAATLMVAVVTALASVMTGVRTNDSYMRARHGAENVLQLMVTKVRRAKELGLETPAGATFTRLRVLDDATWDAANGRWSDKNASWSVFEAVDGQLVMTREKSDANGAVSDDGTFPLSSHVRNTSFRSTLDGGKNRSITIDLTVDCVDAFANNKMTSFSLTGTAVARSLVLGMGNGS